MKLEISLPRVSLFWTVGFLAWLTAHPSDALAQIAPSADLFVNRYPIEGIETPYCGNTRLSTREPGEPDHSGQGANGFNSSVWATWRASNSGLLVAEVSGSNTRLALGIYEGKQLDQLRALFQGAAPNSSQSVRALFPVEVGSDYQFAIAAFGDGGDFCLRLRLVTLPEFEQQPEDIIATDGELVEFKAAAIGPPPLLYAWRHNGNPLNNASSNVLVLRNAGAAQAGFYSMTVRNEFGTVTSRSARLTVRSEPKILVQPRSLFLSDGDDATFSVIAIGGQPLEYRWEVNGAPNPNATNSTLTLGNVQVNQQGSYRVVVSNASGRITSEPATLTVSGSAPVVLSDPLGGNYPIGAEITLSVIASGSKPLGFQWLRDGVELSGATRDSFVVSNAQLSDSGNYSVRVTNSRGAIVSKPAVVRILPPPPNDRFADRIDLTSLTLPTTVSGSNLGATREVGEPAHGGSPAAQSVWWKLVSNARGVYTLDFAGTSFTPRVTVYTGAALAALKPVEFSSDFSNRRLYWLSEPGVEYIVAVDRTGSVTGEIRFQLAFTSTLSPPQITRQPTDRSLRSCQSLSLSVSAANQPPIAFPTAYQWKHNGIDIKDATNATYSVNSVEARHAGDYIAVVTGFGGSVTSQKAAVSVQTGPVFLASPTDSTLRLCDSRTLSFVVEGCPTLRLQWKRNGVAIDGATTSTYRIASAQVEHEGVYQVVASNSEGTVESTPFTLSIERGPWILQEPSTSQTVRECASATLRVSAGPSCLPLRHQWLLNGSALPAATNSVLTVSNIQTNQAGSYSVVVANEFGSITSRVARVSVDAKPFIPSFEPRDRLRMRARESFDLEARPESCTPMTFYWLFNGSPLLPGVTNLVSVTNTASATPKVEAIPMVTGITTPKLVFTRPSTNLSGRWSLVASNVAGVTTSREARVEILEPPVNDFFRDALPITGINTTVTGHNILASREPGEPVLRPGVSSNTSVWWSFTNPVPGYLTVDTMGSTFDTLLAVFTNKPSGTIESLVAMASNDDNGGQRTSRIREAPLPENSLVYIAVDGVRGDEGRIQLQLQFQEDTRPPEITRHPKSAAVKAGGNARFEVEIARTPYAAFQWYKGSEVIKAATNRVLSITNVRLEDEGLYHCEVWNKYGRARSVGAALTTGLILDGHVIDATTKRGLEGVVVSVGTVSTKTDAQGYYVLVGARPGGIQANFYADRRVVGVNECVRFHNLSALDAAVLQGVTPGYYDYVDRHFVVVAGTSVTKSFPMTPVLENGATRFVLNWGLNPADLDAHLLILLPDGRIEEIDYLRRGSKNSFPFVTLDADEQRGYGPETITIWSPIPGARYLLFVQKVIVNAAGELASSEGSVKIYNETGAVATVDAPKVGTGRFWTVAQFDGTSGQLAIVNTLTTRLPTAADITLQTTSLSSNAMSGGARVAATLGRQNPAAQNQGSFFYDFGDNNTSSELSPLHCYGGPGDYSVSLRYQDVVNGSVTNSLEVKGGYITVTNAPPRVHIATPTEGALLRWNVPATISAVASDKDGTVVRVQFWVDGQRVGESSQAPHGAAWIPEAEGVFRITAVATDAFGATTTSEPVTVTVRDLTGDILIVEGAPDRAVPAMKVAIQEVDCLGRPLTVRQLDREDMTLDILRTFRLVILHRINEGLPLSVSETALLRQTHEAGVPLYFIGETLAASGARLEPEARTTWQQLTRLLPASEAPPDGSFVAECPASEQHPILRSPYADFSPFEYAGRLEAARAADASIDPVLCAGTAGTGPALLAWPSLDLTTSVPRIVTQNFLVGEDTGDEAFWQRRQLLTSAVAWLIQCPECPVLDMQLHSFDLAPSESQTGPGTTVRMTVRHSGPCDPTGVEVRTTLPDGLRLLSASVTNYYVADNVFIHRLGRLPNGVETNIDLTISAAKAGSFIMETCVAANGPDGFPGDNCKQLEFSLDPVTPSIPLRISVEGGQLRIDLLGSVPPGATLEYSVDLKTWQSAPNIPAIREDAPVYVPATGPMRFFRLKLR